MGWISVKDRLPLNGNRVLIFYDGWQYVSTYEDNEFIPDDAYIIDQINHCPTHWMPLPEPPIQEEMK